MLFRISAVVTLFAALVAAPRASTAQTAVPVGLWDATVTVNDVEIPFRFEIGQQNGQPTGAFLDGEQRWRSTGGRLEGNQLTLEFAGYGAKIEATVAGDTLTGQYNRGTRGAPYRFAATRHVATTTAVTAPSIAGEWRIPTASSKGEKAWRLIVRQQGNDVSAAILRVDGDTGTLSGSYRDGTFVVSHFSGGRPSLYELTPNPDGSLDILQNKRTKFTAVRVDDERAKTVGDPADPSQFTRVIDASRPLVLEFPDLEGTPVSLADARFRNKVVVLSITGSWCPNCHDEAPFLAELYKKYRAQGLEIVLLAFEEQAQLANPERLRAFLTQYGITYTVLLAGEPSELNAKVPGFENLNAFPTTIYLGRDGRVKATHTGFPSAASGEYFAEAKADITKTVETLLAEKPPVRNPATAASAPKPARGTASTAPSAAAASAVKPAAAAKSSAPSQLEIKTSVRRRAGSSTYELIVDVTPKPGLHVYAPGAGGYTPITLTVDGRPGLTAAATTYPQSERYLFKPTNETLPVYERPFRLVQEVSIAAGANRPATLTGVLAYQACDARLCYRPDRVPVTFTLR